MSKKISKNEAIKIALDKGVDFKDDFHAQSIGDLMQELAEQTGYKKSKSASGSLGRCFFYHLASKKEAQLTTLENDGKKYRCTRKPESKTDAGQWQYYYTMKSGKQWHEVVNREIRFNLNKIAGFTAE